MREEEAMKRNELKGRRKVQKEEERKEEGE